VTGLKFLELGRLNQPYMAAFMPIAAEVLASGMYIGGSYVDMFEREFARYCGVERCVSVANGLDALILALRALNIGAGDEVIVPAQTFVATWLAVSAVGATVVPVDVELETANINPKLIESAVTSRTKAIIPVHLYGAMADMTSIMEIAQRHSLWVIEDAAQAHGAQHENRKAGSIGHVGCFSFYPSKNLGALGDAGGVTTNDTKIADRVRLIANYGAKIKYVHTETGMNSRMDPIQAAFLSFKLNYLDQITGQRKSIAAKYSNAVEGKNSLRRLLKEDTDCVWHNYVICADDRDDFIAYMEKSGVGTALHYPIIPSKQECYAADFGERDFPVANQLAREGVSLPIGEYLTDDEVDAVVATIRSY
jgi:dTDP-4-amino-4,6-dideoxygalactose transaminase